MSSNVSSFPASGRKIPKSKASPDRLPLHGDQRLVLETYLSDGDGGSPQVIDACDRLEVPQNVECTRLAAAVAQVLLHSVQARLPQWSVTDGDRVVFARPYRHRSVDQSLAFAAQHLFTINWADSGPAFVAGGLPPRLRAGLSALGGHGFAGQRREMKTCQSAPKGRSICHNRLRDGLQPQAERLPRSPLATNAKHAATARISADRREEISILRRRR
jgi:hypothetical protein